MFYPAHYPALPNSHDSLLSSSRITCAVSMPGRMGGVRLRLRAARRRDAHRLASPLELMASNTAHDWSRLSVDGPGQTSVGVAEFYSERISEALTAQFSASASMQGMRKKLRQSWRTAGLRSARRRLAVAGRGPSTTRLCSPGFSGTTAPPWNFRLIAAPRPLITRARGFRAAFSRCVATLCTKAAGAPVHATKLATRPRSRSRAGRLTEMPMSPPTRRPSGPALRVHGPRKRAGALRPRGLARARPHRRRPRLCQFSPAFPPR